MGGNRLLPTKRLLNRLLFVIGVLWFIARFFILFVTAIPYDAWINFAGIHALSLGQPLYLWSVDTAIHLFSSFISTPFVAIVLWPLSTGPSIAQSVVVFRIVSAILYIIALFILVKTIRLDPDDGTLTFGIFWLIALAWEPMFDSIGLGQLNEIVLLCLAVSYWAWLRNHEWVLGVSISVAIAVKLIPGLPVGYLLLRRRWRAVLIICLVTAVLMIFTCMIIPLNECTAFVFDILPAISRGSSYHYNQTLNGFGMRLLSSYAVWDQTGLEPNRPMIRSIASVGSVFLISLTVLALRPWVHSRQLSIHSRSLGFGLMIILMLLVSPITWWHYYVWTVVSLASILQPEVWRTLRRSHILWLGISLLLINMPPKLLYRLTESLAERWQFGANVINTTGFIGTLSLWAFFLYLYQRIRHPQSVQTQ